MKKLKTVLALSGLLLASTSWADAPAQVKQQVPGYYRLAVGEYEVTALFDGYNDLSPALLHGLSGDKVRELLAQHKVDAERMPTAFNAFLVNTGKHLVMIDSGGGPLHGGNGRPAGQQYERIRVPSRAGRYHFSDPPAS